MEIEQYKCYNAKIEYKRTDDLRPEALPNGSNVIVKALWIADENENYAGQWIMMPANGHHWLPQCDLIIKEEVPYDVYRTEEKKFKLKIARNFGEMDEIDNTKHKI
jgi:hypothetical protein